MSKVNYGRIIQGILIAVISIVLGYYMEPLIAVLGLLIATSYVAVAVVQHLDSETLAEHRKKRPNHLEG